MYLHATSGLMSRCVSLAQMYNLLKKNEIDNLTVFWPIDNSCGIGFWDVFEDDMFSDINFKVNEYKHTEKCSIKIGEMGGFRKNFKTGNVIGILQYLFLRIGAWVENALHVRLWLAKYWNVIKGTYIDYYSGDQDESIVLNEACHKLYRLLNDHKDGFVRAYCVIDTETENTNYDCIKFKNEYREAVEKTITKNEKFVGVHIRRTDHAVCISNSSTESFVKQMKEICDKEPDTKFFLATDDIREEEYLTEIFGDRIVVQPNKKWGRLNADEMKSGIIDMLCLASCDYILGSYTSVFSWFAAAYGEKELLICKN